MEFKDFEQALRRLEQIVAELEKGELPLERALELFEEGIKISRLCGEKLADAERKVEILVKDNQGSLNEEPLNLRDEQVGSGEQSGE